PRGGAAGGGPGPSDRLGPARARAGGGDPAAVAAAELGPGPDQRGWCAVDGGGAGRVQFRPARRGAGAGDRARTSARTGRGTPARTGAGGRGAATSAAAASATAGRGAGRTAADAAGAGARACARRPGRGAPRRRTGTGARAARAGREAPPGADRPDRAQAPGRCGAEAPTGPAAAGEDPRRAREARARAAPVAAAASADRRPRGEAGVPAVAAVRFGTAAAGQPGRGYRALGTLCGCAAGSDPAQLDQAGHGRDRPALPDRHPADSGRRGGRSPCGPLLSLRRTRPSLGRSGGAQGAAAALRRLRVGVPAHDHAQLPGPGSLTGRAAGFTAPRIFWVGREWLQQWTGARFARDVRTIAAELAPTWRGGDRPVRPACRRNPSAVHLHAPIRGQAVVRLLIRSKGLPD